MKKLWIICTVVVPLASGFALQTKAEDQKAAGRWTGTARGFNTTHSRVEMDDFTMVLRQDGQVVAGSLEWKLDRIGTRGGKVLENRPVKGTLVGDKLSLTIGKTRWFKASVNGDSMSGETANGSDPPKSVFATRTK